MLADKTLFPETVGPALIFSLFFYYSLQSDFDLIKTLTTSDEA